MINVPAVWEVNKYNGLIATLICKHKFLSLLAAGEKMAALYNMCSSEHRRTNTHHERSDAGCCLKEYKKKTHSSRDGGERVSRRCALFVS
jgi:hypothetical protein